MSKEKKMIEGQLSFFDLLSTDIGVEDQTNTIVKAQKVPVKQISKPKSFSACRDCWCSDCRHNAANEGIPRDICGTMQACPACDMCVDSGEPQVCIIGSADEGCSVRAAEEEI